MRGSLSRQSLELSALRLDSQSARLAWLAKFVPQLSGTGIVYTLTVRDAKRLSRWFNEKGIPALAYDGSMENAERLEVEDALRGNAVKVVCSTSALGMGFDKPDLSFVIHFQSPGSPVSYYQQVGRAGRAIERATGMLLAGEEDQNIWDYFLQTSLPVQAQANEVVDALAREADWMTIGDLEAVVNLRRSRLEGLLKVLEVEGAVEKERSRYRRTLARWTFDAERFARVRALREAEQAAMREYAGTSSCRMRFLQGQLDDDDAIDCGRCDNCVGQPVTADVTAAELSEASRFLRNAEVVIEPRKVGVARDCLVEQGAALCTLSDGGWGDSVLDAKRAQRLPEEDMLEAFAECVRRWSPQPRPTWITYIPGLDPHRQLVRDLAQDLGRRLNLPVRPAVVKVRVTEPQKLMQNSKQQAANIRGAYRVETSEISTDPVFLVDDIVDSRWTMAVVGEQLLQGGIRTRLPCGSGRILLVSMITQRDLALVALTTRAVASEVQPLSSREVHTLPGLADPETLLGCEPQDVAAQLRVEASVAARTSLAPGSCAPSGPSSRGMGAPGNLGSDRALLRLPRFASRPLG